MTFPTPKSNAAPNNTAASVKTKVANIRLNKLGRAVFDGMFGTMYKHEDFHVHQLRPGSESDRVVIQSEKRIGWITSAGEVFLSPSVATGVRREHLDLALYADKLSCEQMFFLRSTVFGTAPAAAVPSSAKPAVSACPAL